MLKTFMLCALLMLTPLLASAQSRYLKSPQEARQVTEGIVASIAANNFDGALKDLRPLSVVHTADFDVFEAQVNSQQANILRQFGEPKGYEFIREEAVGSRLVRYQFLVFHEKAAMRWNFVVYKAEKGWVISHFLFDTNPNSFFSSGS